MGVKKKTGSYCGKEFANLHFPPFIHYKATVMLYCSQKKQKMR